MEEQLRLFPAQFSYEPVIMGTLSTFSRAIVCGMGGSGLPARLLHAIDASLPLSLHQDYGLPFSATDEKPLIILSSYSGTTEEVLDSLEEATRRSLPSIAIASGGTLITRAKELGLPYIELPHENVEPRMAVGHAMLALLAVLGATSQSEALRAAGRTLSIDAIIEAGTTVSRTLKDRVPLIYASATNSAIAYFWKIAINETAKIPAFMDAIPEACHNELTGFDVVSATAPLSERFVAVFLHDDADHPRNGKRLALLQEIMREKGIETAELSLAGDTRAEKVLSGILTGVATAIPLAHAYGVPDAATPLVEEFKKRLKS